MYKDPSLSIHSFLSVKLMLNRQSIETREVATWHPQSVLIARELLSHGSTAICHNWWVTECRRLMQPWKPRPPVRRATGFQVEDANTAIYDAATIGSEPLDGARARRRGITCCPKGRVLVHRALWRAWRYLRRRLWHVHLISLAWIKSNFWERMFIWSNMARCTGQFFLISCTSQTSDKLRDHSASDLKERVCRRPLLYELASWPRT